MSFNPEGSCIVYLENGEMFECIIIIIFRFAFSNFIIVVSSVMLYVR